jgi:hypothetical protein
MSNGGKQTNRGKEQATEICSNILKILLVVKRLNSATEVNFHSGS